MTLLVAASFNPHQWAAWWSLLQAALPDEHLVREVTDANRHTITAALVANPPAGSLSQLPQLQFIQSLWAGVDKLLLDPTVPSHIPLARMVDPAMNHAMAHTALWALMSLQRGFFDYAAQQHAGVWQAHAFRGAHDIRVTVLGLGQMGLTTAQCLAHHGFKVMGWSRTPVDVAPSGITCYAGEAELPQVLAQSDVVVNLLPLTPATQGIFNVHTLAQLPQGASLVNLARGAHVVEPDLLAALNRGHLHRAVLDVFSSEPLPAEHAFWRHPRVTVLPHIAAPTDPRSAAPLAACNLRRWREGLVPENVVNRNLGY
jgi:glyoxylate/hydroxypyruvate reductase